MVNKLYMESDIPEVFLVCMVLTACGKNETVVLKAANNPTVVAISIFINVQMCVCANMQM